MHPGSPAPLMAALCPFSLSADAAEGGVKAGYLKCDDEGNVSFIFGSSRDIHCTYTPDAKDGSKTR